MILEPRAGPTRTSGMGYPPAPWRLRGTAYISLWQVEEELLPDGCLPRGVAPLRMLGRVLVGAAFAVYEPGGVLAYNEVLLAVAAHRGIRPALTVPHIWVDHPASVAGARAMWNIPKQVAAFQILGSGSTGKRQFEARAVTPEGQLIADLRFRQRAPLPGRWPMYITLVQGSQSGTDETKVQVTNASAWAEVSLGIATWRFEQKSVLYFLQGREPFLSLQLNGLSLRIGRA
jgi:hypothetical protein